MENWKCPSGSQTTIPLQVCAEDSKYMNTNVHYREAHYTFVHYKLLCGHAVRFYVFVLAHFTGHWAH